MNEAEKKALRQILEFLVPERINVSLNDVVKGYSKQRTIERILKEAEKDAAMASLRLRKVFLTLKRCYEPINVEVFLGSVVPSVLGDPADTR